MILIYYLIPIFSIYHLNITFFCYRFIVYFFPTQSTHKYLQMSEAQATWHCCNS